MNSRWVMVPVVLAAACAANDRSENPTRSSSRAEGAATDAAVAPVPAAACVRAIEIGTFGGDATVMDINERGEAVGFEIMADGTERAFYWDGTSFRELDAPGRSARATAINERGEITVNGRSPDDITRGYVWRNGTFVELGSLADDHTLTWDINDAGDVVGTSRVDEMMRAFRWRDGVMTDLGVINGDSSHPQSINERGQVLVASEIDSPDPTARAFLWDEATVTDLNPFAPAEAGSGATDLNQRGNVLVSAWNWQSGERGAFLWRDGTYTRIVPFDGTYEAGFSALNDRDVIVGVAMKDVPNDQISRAYLWREGATTEIITPGGHEERVSRLAINANAQVAGTVEYPFVTAGTRAFTWKDGTWLYLDGVGSEIADMNDRGLIAGRAGPHPSRRAKIWDTTRCFGGPTEPPPDAGSSSGDAGGGSSSGDGGKTW